MFTHTRGSAKRVLPSLDGKLKRFDTKKVEKAVCQTQVRPERSIYKL